MQLGASLFLSARTIVLSVCIAWDTGHSSSSSFIPLLLFEVHTSVIIAICDAYQDAMHLRHLTQKRSHQLSSVVRKRLISGFLCILVAAGRNLP